MEKKINYKAKGIVLGNAWGGGQIAYPSIEYTNTDIEELYKDINKGIEDGSIDSGMGFESVIGAIMKISVIKKVVIDNEDYSHRNTELKSFGDLTDDQLAFLEDINI